MHMAAKKRKKSMCPSAGLLNHMQDKNTNKTQLTVKQGLVILFCSPVVIAFNSCNRLIKVFVFLNWVE